MVSFYPNRFVSIVIYQCVIYRYTPGGSEEPVGSRLAGVGACGCGDEELSSSCGSGEKKKKKKKSSWSR